MATTKANEKAKRILELYVSEKNLALIDFGSVTPSQLDTVLSKFYLEARTATGNHYKASSLMNFRQNLNRLLQSVPYDRNINVVKDLAFQSNETFKTAMCELKALGNGEVDHYPQITLSDLRKISWVVTAQGLWLTKFSLTFVFISVVGGVKTCKLWRKTHLKYVSMVKAMSLCAR